MRHQASQELHAYWDGIRGQRSAPERGEFDPTAVSATLRDVFILSREPDRGVWQFRLAGTRLCSLFGRELKGCEFASLWTPRERDDARRITAAVADDSAPVTAGIDARDADGCTCECELLLLPLRHQGRTHARMIGGLFPARPLPEGTPHPVVALSFVSLKVLEGSAPQRAESGFYRRPALLAGEALPRRGHLTVVEGGRS